MFCNQCEQTAHGQGCTTVGVCGKDPDVQSLQETLLYGVKGMAAYSHHARRLGKSDPAVSAFIEEALFATMTNVNFDLETLFEMILECGRQNQDLRGSVRSHSRRAVGQVSTFLSPTRHAF